MPESSSLRTLHVVGAAILEGPRCLVAQRSKRMPEPGKWEFPGGKVEPGETPREALAREIREELALEIEVGERLGRGCVERAGRQIVLDVYAARRVGGTVRLAEHVRSAWITAQEIEGLDWAEADLPVLPALARALGRESFRGEWFLGE